MSFLLFDTGGYGISRDENIENDNSTLKLC